LVNVAVISTEERGDRSYVAHDDEGAAVVVDRQQEIDRIEHLLATKGLDCVLVLETLETHLHNDYLSGGFELARRAGATGVMGATEPVAFDHQGVSDGDERRPGTSW
jgi:hydroxyacylglutathione hydrolase